MAIYIEDEKMSKEKVLEKLGLRKSDLPPSGRQIKFEVASKRQDKLNGGFRYTKAVMYNSEFSVFVEGLGYEVRIKYATSTSVITKKGDRIMQYNPKRIRLSFEDNGATNIMSDTNEEALWWFLNPMCKQSPFRKPGRRYRYAWKDDESEALKGLEAEEERIQALQIIVGKEAWSIVELRRLAKGLEIGSVDKMTDNQVKTKLKELIYADAAKFIEKANDRNTKFSGKVQDAIDHGVITIKTEAGKKNMYVAGQIAAVVPFGAKEGQFIRDVVLTDMETYWDAIEKALSGKTNKSELANPEFDKYFEEPKVPNKKELANIEEPLKKEIRRFREDDKFKEKIEELMDLDLSDPTLHWAKKKAYENHKELIDKLRAEREAEAAFDEE